MLYSISIGYNYFLMVYEKNMIVVYLCDDNEAIRAFYKKELLKIAKKSNEEISIREFSSGESLIFTLEHHPSTADIIYLDIVMPGINGIETAKKLRGFGCTSEIIFLTSEEKYVFESFDVLPTNYIVKSSTTSSNFEKIFTKAVNNTYNKTKDFFTCKKGSITNRIPLSEIYYFEVSNRVIQLHSSKEVFSFYDSMNAFEERLVDSNFIRTHRAFLVNLHAVRSISSDHLIIVNGEKIPVGRTYHLAVQENISKYLASVL